MAVHVIGAVAVGGLISSALFELVLGVRPDIGNAFETWRFTAKVTIAMACFAAALWATKVAAQPHRPPSKILPALLLPLALLGVAVCFEFLTSPANTWKTRAIGSNSGLCLASITLLSIAPLVALLLSLKAGAPRSPRIAGALAGLLASGLGATLYALHCPDDSPLFVALWYTPPVALMALIGATIGSRMLRW
jgi:hypothetical protein